jgi:hypothetical protein
LTIQVSTFKAVRKERLKSLGRYDTNVPFDPNIPKEKQIINDITYIIEGD